MSTPWQRLPADLPAAVRPRLPDTVRTITDAVGEAARAAAAIDNAKFERDVRTAVQVALERFLDLAGTDQPALPPAIREVFVALGAAEARENHGSPASLSFARSLRSHRLLPTDVGEPAPGMSIAATAPS